MNQKKLSGRHAVSAVLFLAGACGAGNALAQPVSCASPVRSVAAVTDPAGHVITTQYQLDSPNLQTLLSTTINAGSGCLVAHLTGLATITDNYVVFQVRVDGVPMTGHWSGLSGVTTPVVPVFLDALSAAPYNDEQFIDPSKVIAYNFFQPIGGGAHTVEVLAAGGSSIDPANPPHVHNLVLTLEYR